jgi:dTDP-4-amino-4,6-dideoxygalactose transaminase
MWWASRKALSQKLLRSPRPLSLELIWGGNRRLLCRRSINVHAAEAHGAKCAAFSFYDNKIVATGEGGMITTNEDGPTTKLRLYRGQGMDSERIYWHSVIGYNYRMTNIAAAIGCAQLERVNEALEHRRQLSSGIRGNARESPD